MSVIRWLVVQEDCSPFEFARHFESHLARPPPFYMRMRTRRLPLNIPLLLCYTVHVLYSQPDRSRIKGGWPGPKKWRPELIIVKMAD